MKKKYSLTVVLMLIFCIQLMAQQYTASGYWKLEHDPSYIALQQRQNTGQSLTSDEVTILENHKKKLTDYFASMSDDEKALYYKNRTVWSEQPGAVDKSYEQQNADVYSGDRSVYSKYLVSSGLFGLLYGGAAVAVFDMGGGAAAGLPLLTAGAGTLIPLLTLKEKNVTYNSLILSMHGKGIGFAQGAALSLIFTGDNIEDGKLMLGLATASSIALGRVGFNLGRNRPWTPGRASMYSYYGALMPLEGLVIDFAAGAEDPRIFGATSLVFGAGGYLIADMISRKNNYTVGDVTATGVLAGYNALLGFGIMSEIIYRNEDAGMGILFIPAVTTLAGSIAGHSLTRDTRFTNQQGRNLALASGGGALIGLGIAAIINADSPTPYYLLPYATGLGTYAILFNRYKKNNSTAYMNKDKGNKWNINIMPQNIVLNRQLSNISNPRLGSRPFMLPAFSASIIF